jgi:hypothetical protein
MQVEYYYSDDYAGLESGNLKFYYGYEIEDLETEDWCFQVKKNGQEIYRINRTQIEESIDNMQLNDPQDYLVAGIGIWLLLK